jgi:hypothetical protein
MPASYPYVNGSAALVTFLAKLRAAFPATVTVDTLKKMGLAAQNETYIINTLQFLGLIGEDGAKNAGAAKWFAGNASTYASGMEAAIRSSYKDLFETHGDNAWVLPRADLVTFFRMSDGTSEIVGTRQAQAFEALAAQASKRETVPVTRASASTRTNGKAPPPSKRTAPKADAAPATTAKEQSGRMPDLGLSVRIELTLPSTDDPKVYDALFKSMRENLIDPYRV